MNATDFLTQTIRPTLSAMGLASASAEKLLLMTACHESNGFRHKKQPDEGPARSYYQITPEALTNLYAGYLIHRPSRLAILRRFEPELFFADMSDDDDAARGDGGDDTRHDEPWHDPGTLAAWLLDDVYATAAARMLYARIPAALPTNIDDDIAFAAYWKQFWNTSKKDGTVEACLKSWEHCRPAGYGTTLDMTRRGHGGTSRLSPILH